MFPTNLLNGYTIPVRRDKIEIYLLTLLDLLTAHAAVVGAGGRVQFVATLVTTKTSSWQHVALFKELVDDVGKIQGWQLASARAHLPREAVLMRPAVYTGWLAGCVSRFCGTAPLTGWPPSYWPFSASMGRRSCGINGRLDPYGGASSKQQLIYQHARHAGILVDAVSPIERRQQLDEEIQAAKERYNQR